MNNKLVLIIGGVVIACLIAFGAMFFMMWTKMNDLAEKTNSQTEQTPGNEDTIKKIGPIYSLDSFIVNLDDPKLRKYLRITLDLELIPDVELITIEERLPQIRDAILTILPSKHYEEITTPEGKNALRAELMASTNSFFKKELIANIYFTEFVIQ